MGVLAMVTLTALATVLPPSPSAAVMGGAPATGDPAVVELTIGSGTSRVGLCSATLWKPRVLLTAAHCVVPIGSAAPVDPSLIRVHAPGVVAIGPGSAGTVTGVTVPAGFVNASSRVQPDDIAALTLAAPLAPPGVVRLASRAEIDAWARVAAPVEHLGYGRISPTRSTDTPHTLTLPLGSYDPGTGRVRTVNTLTTSPCPGDSGGPLLRSTPGGRVSVGVFAGANATCTTPALIGEPSTVAFAPIGYAALLNPVLTAVGEPEIPGAPGAVTAAVRNRDVTISWQPPALGVGALTGYDVLDGGGNPVCATSDLSCVIGGLADGIAEFTVRARNGQGEGDAEVTRATAVIAPPTAPGRPRVRQSRGRATVSWTAPGGSAVVERYEVRLRPTAGGVSRTLCTARAGEQPAPTECTGQLPPGTHRLIVRTWTGMGQAPPSPPSRPVTVRTARNS